MLNEIKKYIQNVLGISSDIFPFNNTENFPIIIQQQYSFYELAINKNRFVLMSDCQKQSLTPSEIQKHIFVVQRCTGLNVVYVTTAMPAWQRKRLISKNIQFIVPNKQLYLPCVGIVLSETNETFHGVQQLSVCAQEILLLLLNGVIKSPMLQSDLFSIFPYSRQTFSIALRELETLSFVTKTNQWKTKILHFPQADKQFFDQAISYLENPVKRKTGIEKSDSICTRMSESGITLLSQLTSITPPEQEEWAISLANFNKIKSELRLVPIEDSPIILQLWTRAPLLPLCQQVDNVSLYLTLKDHSDERIQMALDELKENFYAHRT